MRILGDHWPASLAYLVSSRLYRETLSKEIKQGEGGRVALEMALRLRLLKVCTALAEDPSSVPSTHLRELTTAYDSSSRGF